MKTLVAARGAEGWCRLRAGDGAKGSRGYDWCWLPLAAPLLPAWRRWLLVRRSVSDPTELTAYIVCAPEATVRETVVQVAGSRWTVERCCEEAKGEVGLDQYAVRRWPGWVSACHVGHVGVCAVDSAARHTPARRTFVKKIFQGSTRGSLTAFKIARGLGCR